jgi:hypothetical protein
VKLELELPVYSPTSHFFVEQDIAGEHFACDLNACKGACCTLPGGTGAPLLPQEVPVIEALYPVVEKYLPAAARKTIANEGSWQHEFTGEITVKTVDGNECVFVHWEGDIAHCAIQTAFRNGELAGYEKPISCHLYPFRIDPLWQKDSYLIRYDIMSECDPARARGKNEGILLAEFLELPLVRALGPERTKFLIDQLRPNAHN